MRKETKAVMTAFLNREPATMARTSTNGESVWLHGNRIAWWTDTHLCMTLAGWPTVTTRDRLNGLLSLVYEGASPMNSFSQLRGQQFFAGAVVDDDEVIRISLADIVVARCEVELNKST